jgi:hypothetical protein
MKGGAFTGNQIYNLFRTFSSSFDNDFTKLSIDNINPLDIKNDRLYNETCHVFYINDSNKIRFVILHRGTITTSVRDWGNNLRNLLGIGLEDGVISHALLASHRKTIAKAGHEELKAYLKTLYNKSELNDNERPIKNMLTHLMNSNKIQIQNIITIDDAVDELLMTTLTTIGHSQGAVYAYLYGNQGKETIVINPAPYKGEKPDNIYVIRRKRDGVSMFTDIPSNIPSNRLTMLPKNEITHPISTLKNLSNVFGNKYLYNHDSNSKNTLFNFVFQDEDVFNPLIQSSSRISPERTSSRRNRNRNRNSPSENVKPSRLSRIFGKRIKSTDDQRSNSTEKKHENKGFFNKFRFTRKKDTSPLLSSNGSK